MAFRNIQHPYIKALISTIPVIDLFQQKRERTILQGDIPATLEECKECRFAFRCSDCQVFCKTLRGDRACKALSLGEVAAAVRLRIAGFGEGTPQQESDGTE